MEETENRLPPEAEEAAEAYTPRPRYQVWGARLLLVIFLLVLAVYYLKMFMGGA